MKLGWVRKLDNFAFRKLWGRDISSLGRFRAFLVKLLRLLYVVVKKLTGRQVSLQATSLVYTTLLSLVPLLAVSFSVLKSFGVHNQIEPLLRNFLAPFGPRAGEVTQKITEFVENMKVGVLGTIGLATLIYTIISLLQKIENAFNSIWKVRRSRSFLRKFSDYMSVISIGPLLAFSAISSIASFIRTTPIQKLASLKPVGLLFYITGRMIPYFLISAVFTFIYIFIPNTKVRFKSALVGGLLAGGLWEGAGWAFASFTVSSTKYAAIYSGLAIIILFMIWLYLSWRIVLIGAEIAFYHQYPQILGANQEALLAGHRFREKLILSIMFLIGGSYYHNTPAWTLNSLVNYLQLPVGPIQDILTILEKKGLVIEINDGPHIFLPARDIETITLKELLGLVRTIGHEQDSLFSVGEVDRIISDIDRAIGKVIGEGTVKDLVLDSRP